MLFFYKHISRLHTYFLFKDNQFEYTIIWTKKKTDLFLVVRLKNFKNTILILKKYFLLTHTSLLDMIVYDTPGKKLRFSTSYLFSSLSCVKSINLIVQKNEIVFLPTLKTVSSLFKWYEIEIWNLFGLLFEKNIDVENILTTYNWNSFPFWKSFSWMKFQNIFYNKSKKSFFI